MELMPVFTIRHKKLFKIIKNLIVHQIKIEQRFLETILSNTFSLQKVITGDMKRSVDLSYHLAVPTMLNQYKN